jgi:hypothetical protein
VHLLIPPLKDGYTLETLDVYGYADGVEVVNVHNVRARRIRTLGYS